MSKLLVAGKVALSALLIAAIARSVDVAAILGSLRKLGWGELSTATLLFVLQATVIGWRWHRIIHLLGGYLPSSKAVHWVFIGLFFNQAMPSSVGGDAVRVWLLHRAGTARGVAFASVLAERCTGVAIIGLLVTVCLPAVWEAIESDALRFALFAAGPFLFTVLLVFAGAGSRIAPLLPLSIRPAVHGVAFEIKSLLIRPRSAGEVAAWGLVSALLASGAAWVIGRRLGIVLELPGYIVFVGGATLLSVLPISLGGWGVREVGMVTLFGSIGIDPESALALSIAMGAIQLLVSLPGGLSWWIADEAKLGAERRTTVIERPSSCPTDDKRT